MKTEVITYPKPHTLTRENIDAWCSQIKKRSTYAPRDEDYSEVSAILRAVQREGDRALLTYSKTFDGYAPDEISHFRVSAEAFEKAKSQISPPLKEALALAKENIWRYHENQMPCSWSVSPESGIELGQRICPMKRVALYIPGGKAAYPSTVLMNAIPAQIAGVSEIAIFTPPNAKGEIDPLVLYAAFLMGITEVYKLGGAQAIGAAAYGTSSIPAVDKIVGPGNRFVALAKKIVFGTVAIDMIAGPSEVLIIADETANPQWIAADLLAQAEHDEDARLYLLTTNFSLPNKVFDALATQLRQLPKASIAAKALNRHFTIFVADTLDLCLELSNVIAPEHLELAIDNPKVLLDGVTAAGSVFLGHATPEALGDYFAGTNHTLPTSSTARFSSPLGVYDFVTRPSYLCYEKDALSKIGAHIMAFAKAEGLEAHSRSIQIRMEE